MPTTHHRLDIIAGLRALADFLEANPDVPAPNGSIPVTYFPALETDAEMRAEIDRVAGLLGSPVDPQFLPYGHHVASVSFGPVRYEAIAILANARARHDALSSYAGCVTPDLPDTSTDPAHAA